MQTTLSCFVCIRRCHCSNSLCLTCTSCVCVYFLGGSVSVYFVLFLLLESGTGASLGQVYPTVLGCVLCVCDLSLWNSSVSVACSQSWGGGIVGMGRAVQRQCGLPLDNHCSFSICTKKKDISNWNFYICPLCCLQPTVMLQMIKPVEKSCFWLYVYWNKGKTSSNHSLINVHWCALHPWLILVVYALFFLPWTSVGVITRGPDFGWSSLEMVT